jgi:signal-transduction protein with cAMP-binding, CBS, and nucleotidyltransferase domain
MAEALESEFADEYQDWLGGHSEGRRAPWFDSPVGELDGGSLLQVAPGTVLADVIALMNEHHRGAVLVVQGERLLGIFTERDVLRRVVSQGLSLAQVQVGELMTANPDTIPEWATLAQALRVMVIGGYRHLPVVDGQGRPKSMVSMRDIIEAVSDAFPKEVLNAPPEKQRFSWRTEGG